MKWVLKEPVFGDIVKVKAGSIYHYGIFVSDEEVIQFGLPPIARQGVRDSDVEICATSIEVFLCDSFLEVGEPDRTDKKRFPPKKTVELARARLGEKGYHILYNNCEHFANECYFGEKYSSQTEGLRALFRNMSPVDVYWAKIPEEMGEEPLFPKERQKEVDAVSHERVKREKYYVWKLLEYALKKSFSRRIEDVKFVKNPSGKWTCDACEFSLSHSHNLAVVVVAKTPVGVDVERVEKPKADIAKEILSGEEYEKYLAMQEEEKIDFLIATWAKKESLFKSKNVKSMTREVFRMQEGETLQKWIALGEERYALSVATSTPQKVKIYENICL